MTEIKKGKGRFYIGESESNNIARITWVDGGSNVIVVNHTYVDPSLRGQSVANNLLQKVVEMAREENLKIVPTCTYVAAKLTRTDEYSDILK